MFEITADDIALLDDGALRELVARLCESDLRRRGISPMCVTSGGNQDARDGGIDVRVELPEHVSGDGFIPRRHTCFQVKAEDTPASKILHEMKPKGILRPSIRELAECSGAYIMVSSEGSVADEPLRDRRVAMTAAVSDLPCREQLKLDFYDRSRLETWIRDHPGATLWAREKIGKPIPGWQAYGNWSRVPAGADATYLLDDELRVRTHGQTTEPGVSAVAGIDLIRARLREPGGVVRVVGLSGVGKTRLAQALFDPAVGDRSLDQDLAAYADIGNGPNPEPTHLASELIASGKRAVLIIDNCRPDLHRQLAELCQSVGTTVSLLTIEYDVQDDIPEGTDVFLIRNASTNLTEKLARQRFPGLPELDARRIAEFSGGNVRMALAVASALTRTGSTAMLTDAELLRRVFQQGQPQDAALQSAAEVLSLVYSFNGEDVSGTGELFQIGEMIGKTAQQMFGFAAELKRRDLVQERSKWRAVLPQALANRLATLALEKIPVQTIESHLVSGGSEHLLKSFSRRLSFLYTSPHAGAIITRWLEPEGLLGDVSQLNELGRTMLENVAPVVPEDTLSAIERGLIGTTDPGAIAAHKPYLRLLRSLAYDAALFDRCLTLIVKIVEADGAGGRRDEGVRLVSSLFLLYFSGTHASIEQRILVAASLLSSESPKRRALGVAVMKSLLEATHFVGGWDFDFGARQRDHGYQPRTPEELKNWYRAALELAKTHACSDGPVAKDVREVLGDHFRGLWSSAQMYDEVEDTFRTVAKRGFWAEGWLAVRQTIRYDSKSFSAEIATRLQALEADLRPRELVDEVRSIVLSRDVLFAGIDGEDDNGSDDPAGMPRQMVRVSDKAEDLGRAVAGNDSIFEVLLPELLTAPQGQGQLWNFGRGVARSAADPAAVWNRASRLLNDIAPTARRFEILGGFLHALSIQSPALANSLLDQAVENESLAPAYPWLQTQVGIDELGVERLMRSLATGRTSASNYVSLVAGHALKDVPADKLRAFLLALAEKPEGTDAAVEILCMQAMSNGPEIPRDPDLVDAGRTLMTRIEFGRQSNLADYRLSMLSRYCLTGTGAADAVAEISKRLGASIARYETHAFYYDDFINELFTRQPMAALQGFCAGFEAAGVGDESGIAELARQRINAIDRIPIEELIAWCDQDPVARYPAAASGVQIFGSPPESGEPSWSDSALKLLAKAPDKVEVLKRFIERFSPWSWTGSRSAIVASNARLLDQLSAGDPTVAKFIVSAKASMARSVEANRDIEAQIYGDKHRSFE